LSIAFGLWHACETGIATVFSKQFCRKVAGRLNVVASERNGGRACQAFSHQSKEKYMKKLKKFAVMTTAVMMTVMMVAPTGSFAANSSRGTDHSARPSG